MYSFSIIAHFNVLKNGCFRLAPRRKDRWSTTLFLQCCPKALHHRIIKAITCTTHTCLSTLLLQQHLIVEAFIFTAARILRCLVYQISLLRPPKFGSIPGMSNLSLRYLKGDRGVAGCARSVPWQQDE